MDKTAVLEVGTTSQEWLRLMAVAPLEQIAAMWAGVNSDLGDACKRVLRENSIDGYGAESVVQIVLFATVAGNTAVVDIAKHATTGGTRWIADHLEAEKHHPGWQQRWFEAHQLDFVADCVSDGGYRQQLNQLHALGKELPYTGLIERLRYVGCNDDGFAELVSLLSIDLRDRKLDNTDELAWRIFEICRDRNENMTVPNGLQWCASNLEKFHTEANGVVTRIEAELIAAVHAGGTPKLLSAMRRRGLTPTAKTMLNSFANERQSPKRFVARTLLVATGDVTIENLRDWCDNLKPGESAVAFWVWCLNAAVAAGNNTGIRDIWGHLQPFLEDGPRSAAAATSIGTSSTSMLSVQLTDTEAVQLSNVGGVVEVLTAAALAQPARRVALIEHNATKIFEGPAPIDAIFDAGVDADNHHDLALLLLQQPGGVRTFHEVAGRNTSRTVNSLNAVLVEQLAAICCNNPDAWATVNAIAPRHAGTLEDLRRAVNNLHKNT